MKHQLLLCSWLLSKVVSGKFQKSEVRIPAGSYCFALCMYSCLRNFSCRLSFTSVFYLDIKFIIEISFFIRVSGFFLTEPVGFVFNWKVNMFK